MALVDLVDPAMVLAAFAGGVFGAAVGALPSFTLAGLVVVVGELYKLLARVGDPGLPAVGITGSIGFGVVLGPHVAFGGGAAALAYAVRRGYHETEPGFPYHPAKEVTRGLGTRPDVLAVGGAFGVLGYGVAMLSASLALPTDPVALGVVVSALAHRAVFGYDLVGASLGRLLDMSPFEEGAATPDGGHAVEPWLPYQYRWGGVAVLGGAMGVLGAYVAYLTGSAFLAFGVSVVALVFVNAGVADVPVTHHMTLPASTGVVALAGASGGFLDPAAVAAALPLGTALLVGAALGLVGALCGELCQRVLYAHAETHLDPPAASIVCTAALLALLSVAGVLPTAAWVPVP